MSKSKLESKSNRIRMWYRHVYEGFKQSEMEPISLTPEQEKFFKSATRWHINSHYRLIDINLGNFFPIKFSSFIKTCL